MEVLFLNSLSTIIQSELHLPFMLEMEYILPIMFRHLYLLSSSYFFSDFGISAYVQQDVSGMGLNMQLISVS